MVSEELRQRNVHTSSALQTWQSHADVQAHRFKVVFVPLGHTHRYGSAVVRHGKILVIYLLLPFVAMKSCKDSTKVPEWDTS